jgi:hypothetical protein
VTTQTKLKDVMLSEISDTGRKIQHFPTSIKNDLIEIERIVVSKAWGDGWKGDD